MTENADGDFVLTVTGLERKQYAYKVTYNGSWDEVIPLLCDLKDVHV